jgi:hypothetical protein
MGFDWKDAVQADASVSDAADAAPALGTPSAFDAGDHKGIAFWAKSNTGALQQVGVHFSDMRQAAAGGECDASVYFNSPVECGDDYFKNVPITASWAQYHVLFADPLVHTQNYTLMGLHAGGLDTHHLYQTHFQINNGSFAGMGAVAPLPAFDISVAYITFYDGI